VESASVGVRWTKHESATALFVASIAVLGFGFYWFATKNTTDLQVFLSKKNDSDGNCQKSE